MKWPAIPTGADKPSWGGFFGTISMIYLFVDAYLRGASTTEWVWTAISFIIFMALCVVASLYWSRKRIMRRVCAAMALLAIAFTGYQQTGVFYFVFVAAFGPLAVGGDIPRSVAIIAAACAGILIESLLLWPPSLMPYVAVVQSILVGGAITLVARQQAALRQTLKSAERERIARDLHDILGHTLSVVILKTELASRLIAHDPARAKAEIDEVEKISRNALAEIREAIRGYRSHDLRAELDQAKSTLETAGVTVEEEYDAAGLPLSHERVLALVLREAVTNIVRHAQAKRCSIRFERDEDVYRLEVKDDGRGGVREEGMGLRGIRERVEAIGGQATWASDSGTALTITVPRVVSTAGELT